MSWFGGSLPQLSSITDQISSFTKEVLTETTEEVEGMPSENQILVRTIESNIMLLCQRVNEFRSF